MDITNDLSNDIKNVFNNHVDNEIMKEEEEEEAADHDMTAQALMTLHDSVQNMPRKHKTALQEAVYEASPTKKQRSDDNNEMESLNAEPNDNSQMLLMPKLERVSRKINNILKQSAGRKWVFHEWFYSNIDRSLLLEENDFQICLNQVFPQLNTRKLTRSQWSMIRRIMGKPRRCSPAFLQEERRALEEKRKKIRLLHQKKGLDVSKILQFKDLPDEIPVPMVVGTKVSAKVHPSGNGVRLFTGRIDAIDNVNNSFRISFDRKGVESRSVPDIDTASQQYDCMNLKLFMVKERPKIAGSTASPDIRLAKALDNNKTGTYGGFPIQFLINMMTLSKLVKLKKKCVDKLKKANDQAELKHPYKNIHSKDFQKQYAGIVLELEKINNIITEKFDIIDSYISESSNKLIKHECDEYAEGIMSCADYQVKSSHLKNLVQMFASLMLQISKLSETEPGSLDLSLLDESLNEIKTSIKDENQNLFQDKIETTVGFIKSGLQNGNSLLASFVKNHENINSKSIMVAAKENGYLSSSFENDTEEEEVEDDYEDVYEENDEENNESESVFPDSVEI